MVGILIIFLSIEKVVDLAVIVIAMVSLMYTMAKTSEKTKILKKPRQVQIVSVTGNDNLSMKINERTKRLNIDKKIVIDIVIVDDKKAVIHYC